ncbi:alpha/beta hydrolase family protein [Amycolatopsis suaedae]|uniref:Alpha/beta fold hydrolase n=1 Tax=Amycolatopsis suaedae TaxID=2510978 RepID=A0A4Q7J3Z8_9PSEU|nr:alpha/beta fold hydrolase [Amycolatopsis suaedae]RZQ62261.1 alpha/beta fold hydrolase [Amycolatopsis suaedae]
MRSSFPRRRAIAFAVAAVLGVAGTGFGSGWYYSGEILSASDGGRVSYDEKVLGSTAETITLTPSSETVRPGRFKLLWEGGHHLEMGAIVRNDPDRVERVVLSGTPPPAGTQVAVANRAPTDDPSTIGLEFDEVQVPTELGEAPAWHVPGRGDTWVIKVHGRIHVPGARSEGLRVMPAVHRLSLPILAITYRNDHGAPASPDSFGHLGESEWRDLEAAMEFARTKGARRFILIGWSMGGMIITQLLTKSKLADAVDAVVLDSPALDLRAAVDLEANHRGVPTFLTPLAEMFVDARAGVDFDRMKPVDHPPRVRPPTLLIHGDEDTVVPVESSRALANAAGRLNWPVQYEEFAGAEHTGSWNVDPTRYEDLLVTFLTGSVRR